MAKFKPGDLIAIKKEFMYNDKRYVALVVGFEDRSWCKGLLYKTVWVNYKENGSFFVDVFPIEDIDKCYEKLYS